MFLILQEFENWDDVGLNMARPPSLAKLVCEPHSQSSMKATKSDLTAPIVPSSNPTLAVDMVETSQPKEYENDSSEKEVQTLKEELENLNKICEMQKRYSG